MLRTIKPRNARAKRAMDARAPKEVEDARTAIFVRGSNTGDLINNVLKELLALKRPHAIAFSKKNTIHPFEDAASLDFWSGKNDAGMFVIGSTTKKRPNGLVFARMFDNKVLDMCEFGVENFKSMTEFKTPGPTPGHRPLLHFASELFDTHPRYQQIKSLLLSFFNGEEIDAIHLAGIEHVISITLAPTPPNLPAHDPLSSPTANDLALLPIIHIRTYTLALLASGVRTPYASLTQCGPSLDLRLRRHADPDATVLAAAMKRPKLKQKDVEKGLGKKKKNLEVDEMGDLRGRVHVGKQDLDKLQTRKMKGLKKGREEDGNIDDDTEFSSGPGNRKKRKVDPMDVVVDAE